MEQFWLEIIQRCCYMDNDIYNYNYGNGHYSRNESDSNNFALSPLFYASYNDRVL